MRGDRDLYRRLFHMVHLERLKNPHYQQELRQRERQSRWQLVWTVALIPLVPLFLALFLFIGIAVVPLAFMLPLHAFLFSTFIHDPRLFGTFGATPLLVLGVPSLSFGVLICMLCTKQAEVFWSQEALYTATFFPSSDRDARRTHPNRWRFGQLYLAYSLFLGVVSTAMLVSATPLQIAMLCLSVPLSVCQVSALVIVALSLTRCSRDPQSRWVLPTMTFIIAAALALFAGKVVPPWQDLAGQLCVMLPTGWVNGAVYYLAFEPTPLGLLFLIPIGITWLYAAWWLRRGISIRELFLSSADDWTPVFEFGLRNPLAIEALYDSSSSGAGSAAHLGREREAIRSSLVVQATKFVSSSWSDCGWVERLMEVAITPRERTIVEHSIGRERRWTRAWWWSAGLVLAFTAILGCGEAWIDWNNEPNLRTGEGELTFGALAIMLVLPLIVLGEFLAALPSGAMPVRAGFPRQHPVYPLGWTEYRRAIRKLIWLRLGLYLPLFLAPLMLDLSEGPELILLDCLGIISLVVVFGTTMETLGCLGPSAGVLILKDWRSQCLAFARLLPSCVLVVVGLSGAYLTAWAIIMKLPLLVVPGWLVMFAGSLGVQGYWRWRYHRAELDFVCGETIASDPRRRM